MCFNFYLNTDLNSTLYTSTDPSSGPGVQKYLNEDRVWGTRAWAYLTVHPDVNGNLHTIGPPPWDEWRMKLTRLFLETRFALILGYFFWTSFHGSWTSYDVILPATSNFPHQEDACHGVDPARQLVRAPPENDERLPLRTLRACAT